MASSRHVEPIYGWGWIGEAEASRDVPSAMDIKIEQQSPREWQGEIISASHEFHGARVRLSLRHVEDDGLVNIKVVSRLNPEKRLASGFARIVVNDEG